MTRRTPAPKRGPPEASGTTPENPRPQDPNPPTTDQASYSNVSSGPCTTRKGNPSAREAQSTASCESGQATASSEPDGARKGDHVDGGKEAVEDRDMKAVTSRPSGNKPEAESQEAKARTVGVSPGQESTLALDLESKNPLGVRKLPLGGARDHSASRQGPSGQKKPGHLTRTPVHIPTFPPGRIQVSLLRSIQCGCWGQ